MRSGIGRKAPNSFVSFYPNLSTVFILFLSGVIFIYQYQVKVGLEEKHLVLIDELADKQVALKRLQSAVSGDNKRLLNDLAEKTSELKNKNDEILLLESQLTDEKQRAEQANNQLSELKEALLRSEQEVNTLKEREGEYQSRLRSTARLIDKMSRDHVDKHNTKANELTEVHNRLKAKLKEENLRGESMVYPRMQVKPSLIDETTVYRPFCVDNFAFRFLDFGDEANSMRARASKEAAAAGRTSKEHCIYKINKEHYDHVLTTAGQEFLPSSGGIVNFLSLFHYLSVSDEKVFVEVGSGGGRADFTREAFSLWGTPVSHVIEWNPAAFETLSLRQRDDKITFAQSSLSLHRGLPSNVTGHCRAGEADQFTGAVTYHCKEATSLTTASPLTATAEGGEAAAKEKETAREDVGGDVIDGFTMDKWFADHIDPQKPVDVMRIQTDAGMELNVLRGMKKSLESRRVNILILEYIEPFWLHTKSYVSNAVGGLNSLGYDVYLMGSRNLLRVSPPYWDERLFEAVKWTNVLAVSKAHPLAERFESSYNIDLPVSSICENM